MKAVAGIKYTYGMELPDVGRYGFILPAAKIRPTGEETWAAVYAVARELNSRVYADYSPKDACPAL